MSRVVKGLITEKELKSKIDTALNALGGSYYEYRNLTPTVTKDLSKVTFDLENVCDNRKDAFRGFADLVGLHTLPSGLAYFGIGAGGDWEAPIFFIIYWDGKELRGYIPKDGNPWNTDNNSAYGNDEDSDIANLKKVHGISTMDPVDDAPDLDKARIIADIEARIKVPGESEPEKTTARAISASIKELAKAVAGKDEIEIEARLQEYTLSLMEKLKGV